ncbi:hypothetical protein PAL_GLEAN10015091 [Pteropus alecto]|uniref:Uncharacterized protein n=1 Tax=Pteropus alecto TaxID=9402 RepID=L5JUB6_PTEAL|nr:hypothetical protein PAL_GLEAN10015091 [Pteropus alecto]
MELGGARIQQPQVQDSSYSPKGLNEKAMQVEVRMGDAASVHQPPIGKFAGQPHLASEHLQFVQLYSGNLELPPHTPQEVWERRQKKVDSFIRDPADSRDPKKGDPAPPRPDPRMHQPLRPHLSFLYWSPGPPTVSSCGPSVHPSASVTPSIQSGSAILRSAPRRWPVDGGQESQR